MSGENDIIAGTKETNEKIKKIFNSMSKLVCEKNKRYGNIAAEPLNIFGSFVSKDNDNGINSILIRLDDKLSRIKNSDGLRKNDVSDTQGYIALLCAALDWTNFDEFID